MRFELLVIDLDNTLYAANNGVFSRMDKRMIAFIARELHMPTDDADALRIKYWKQYGSTLRGLMLHHGVDAEAFLQDVHDVQAHDLLQPDDDLHSALEKLKPRKVIHTNGTREHAERILMALNVQQHFEQIYDIRYKDYMPKPCEDTLKLLCKEEGISPDKVLVVDDMPENLAAAQAIGARTCWISENYQASHPWDYALPSVVELPMVLHGERLC